MKKKMKLETLKVKSFVAGNLYGGLNAQIVGNAVKVDIGDSGGLGCDTALCGPSRVSACEHCEE
ncbi:MAG: hypothetical protein QNK37_10370 [Acidobacteriota bacterium]|nr:hypothetical protein [Acidobacteriota bacterium]